MQFYGLDFAPSQHNQTVAAEKQRFEVTRRLNGRKNLKKKHLVVAGNTSKKAKHSVLFHNC